MGAGGLRGVMMLMLMKITDRQIIIIICLYTNQFIHVGL